MQINLKDLWNKQTIEIASPEEIYKKVTKFRKKQLFNLLLLSFVLVTTVLFIVSIWIIYNPKLITTKIGIIIIIAAIIVSLISNKNKYLILKKVSIESSLMEYLSNLIQLKKHQSYLQKVTMKVYFLLLTLGISLYMYEYASNTMLSLFITYGLTFCWILFNFFYILPKQSKKEETKINEILEDLETQKDNLNTD